MIGPTSEFSSRLTLSRLVLDMDPVVQLNLLILVAFTCLLIVLAASEILTEGRVKSGTLVTTTTLALLAPLMGVYAAAYNLMNTFIGGANTGSVNLAISYVSFAESAFCIGFGALIGMFALVARMAFKLREARDEQEYGDRPETPRKNP